MLDDDPNNESSEDKPFQITYHSHFTNPNEYYLKVSELIDYLNYEANKHPDLRDLERITIESIRDAILNGLKTVQGNQILKDIEAEEIMSRYKRLDLVIDKPWTEATSHFNCNFRLDENGNVISKEETQDKDSKDND